MNARIPLLTLMLSVTAPVTTAWAHHSIAEYDQSKSVEIEGTLVEVKWQNPHIHLRVRAASPTGGDPVVWEIECSSLSVMRRTNATADGLEPGDKVRVAGDPSRRAPNRLFALNVLKADGTEIVLYPGGQPRWAKVAVGTKSTWLDPGTAENAGAGLFRVWSTKLDVPESLWPETYPLTDAAKKIMASWDPIRDSVSPGCKPKGMPTIMEQPYPIEFVRLKDTILLRMEEYDTVRTIYMTDKVAPSSLPTHRLGRSMGRWDGNTLVVKTDGIAWPYLDPNGTPLSPAATLLERFTPAADGTRLEYSVLVTDPKFLARPLELKRSWVARPNESVKPYNCGRS